MGALRTAVALVLLASCRPNVPRIEAPVAALPDWCFSANVVEKQGPYTAVGCFDTQRRCERAKKLAVQFGGYAGVQGVGDCGLRSLSFADKRKPLPPGGGKSGTAASLPVGGGGRGLALVPGILGLSAGTAGVVPVSPPGTRPQR